MDIDHNNDHDDNDDSSSISIDTPTLDSIIESLSDQPLQPMTPLNLPPFAAAPLTPTPDTVAFLCSYCERSFPSKRGLSNHERTKHADMVMTQKAFKCQTCGMGFTRLSSLNKHTQIKHTKMSFVEDEPVRPVSHQPEFVPESAPQGEQQEQVVDVEPPLSCHGESPFGESPFGEMPFEIPQQQIPYTYGPYSLHDQVMMYQAQNQLLMDQLNRVFDYFLQRRQ